MFLNHEAAVNKRIGFHQVLAVCLFPLVQWPGLQLLDILRYHPLALIKRAAHWETVRSPDNWESRKALGENQQRQRAILDAIPDLAWLKDCDGRFLAVNAAWSRYCKTSNDEALGKTVRDIFPAHIAERFCRQDAVVVQTGQPLREEEFLPDQDGCPRWFETIKYPVCNQRMEVIGTAGLARDITERKQAEDALRRETAFRSAVIQNAAEGLCVCHAVADPPFVAFTVWNDRMAEITGYTMEQINRRGW